MEYFVEVSFTGTTGKDYGKRLSDVFQAAHRALNKEGNGLVGMSFPEWKSGDTPAGVSLGQRFYLVSSDMTTLEQVVTELQAEVVALGVSTIEQVPAGASRRIFCRSRQHQRYFHHHLHGDDQGKADAAKKLASLQIIPSVKIGSKSTRQSFRIAIDCRPAEDAAEGALFNSYGLSSSLSVPVF